MWTSTPTPQPTWTWDPDRREYYHFSFAEACWQYQSGLKVFTDGREIDPAPSQTAASSEYVVIAPTSESTLGHT
jgi:hypothetical protein